MKFPALVLLALISLPPAAAQPPSTPWLDVEESGGIVYFVFTSPARIERYDMAAQAWLSDIALPATPTAFTVDSQHLYVSFGRRTSRFNLNGSGEVHLRNTPVDTEDLYVVGGQLILSTYDQIWSVDKLSGAGIDDLSSYYSSIHRGGVAPGRRKIYYTSSSNVSSIEINPDGTFGEQQGGSYYEYPSGSRMVVFPNEVRVVNDAGIVFNAADLSFSHSLGGGFDSIAFYGDLPIVLRDGIVVAYGNTLLETGRHEPVLEPLHIAVRGETVFFFYQGAGGLEAGSFPIDLLDPAEPGEPVDPNGLPFEPDEIILGRDDVVYILSRAHLSIFRWSVLGSRYLETIPLAEAPRYMAYSAKTHRLYLAYSGGAIRQIRLSESVQEVPFANLPQSPWGLSTAGEFVFAGDPTGAWGSHYTFHPDGTLLSEREWNYYSLEYVWSEPLRRMYFFRDDTSPNDIHWEEITPDGHLGEEGESPYHGDFRTQHPLRIAPDASSLVIGSGEIFDPVTLERRDSLSNDIDDAAWLYGTLFTIRGLDDETEVQRWGTNYGVAAQRRLPGEPLRLFGRSANLLAITSVDGIPRFTLLDSALNDFVPLPPLSLADGRFSVQAVWRTPEGNAGVGHAVALTRDTGYFWFFNSANVEMILKVLDGCGVNGHFWVFAGGLTNVEVDIAVVDNLTGQVRTYRNPQGTAFQPIQDTGALSGCSASAALSSEPAAAASELLLNDGRFRVEITWATSNGNSDSGTPVQLTPDTGYFWFFDDDNVEVVVKVLDGCEVNGRYWVFAGGLTNVATQIRVTDTRTGAQKTYTNPQGQPFLPLQDTGAFAGCN